jgi:hypothetical protein
LIALLPASQRRAKTSNTAACAELVSVKRAILFSTSLHLTGFKNLSGVFVLSLEIGVE